jgi:hypothetical protein
MNTPFRPNDRRFGFFQKGFYDLISGRVIAGLMPIRRMAKRGVRRTIGEIVDGLLGKTGLLVGRKLEERRKRLSRVLRELLKHSLSFSVHYQNAASAFKRMSAAGNEAARLLSAAQREVAHGGLALRLSSHGLKVLADQEINRIGLLPAHRAEAGEANSPGTNPRVDLNYANAPHRLPGLEAEIRRLTALLLETAPEPQGRGNGKDLPQTR